MRLQKYLVNEETMSDKHTERLKMLLEIWKLIEKKCQPYLRDVKKCNYMFLRRGVKDTFDIYKEFKSHIKGGRNPKDTPTELHNELNEIFRKEFGWNVRDGVSTTGDWRDKSYGRVRLFFPQGKYKFVWSPSIPDLYSNLEDENMLQGEEMYDEGIFDIYYEEAESEWYSTYGEDGGDGEYYYDGEPTGEQYESDVYNELSDEEKKKYDKSLLEWVPEISLENYIEYYIENHMRNYYDKLYGYISTYKDKNLKEAIMSKNEVMVNCNKYYLLDDDYESDITEIMKRGYEMIFVVNTRRPFTSDEKGIIEMIDMLEQTASLRITEIVCNSNLSKSWASFPRIISVLVNVDPGPETDSGFPHKFFW